MRRNSETHRERGRDKTERCDTHTERERGRDRQRIVKRKEIWSKQRRTSGQAMYIHK